MSVRSGPGRGAGGNFYLGRNVGLSGADRNFSSYMSSKKFPIDYFEEDEEEDEEEEKMLNTVLEKRIKKNGKYCLLETIENINELAFIPSLGDIASDVVGDFIRGITDFAAPFWITKNVTEVLAKTSKGKKLIKKYEQGQRILTPNLKAEFEQAEHEIIVEIIDLAQALVEAFPGLGIETATSLIGGQVATYIAGNAIAKIGRGYESFMGDSSAIKGLFEVGGAGYATAKSLNINPGAPGIMGAFKVMGGGILGHIVFKALGTIGKLDKIATGEDELSAGTQAAQWQSPAIAGQVPQQPQQPAMTQQQQYSKAHAERAADQMFKSFFTIRESMEKMSLETFIKEEIEEDFELYGDDVDEVSVAASIGGGPALPLGSSTKGPKGQHSSTSGGKVFPYTKKSKNKFKKHASKTFGGLVEEITQNQYWHHNTLGKIKF